jgi:hypothetical protein
MNLRPYQPGDSAAWARLFTETVRAINAADYSPDIQKWYEEPKAS